MNGNISRKKWIYSLIAILIVIGGVIPISKNVISYCVVEGHTRVLKVLLMAGLNPDSKIISDQPLMVYALDWGSKNSKQVTQLLIDYGAEINWQGSYGSYLSRALSYGQIESAQLLVESGISFQSIWLANYNSSDELVIINALPKTFPNHREYCEEYLRFSNMVRDSWPGLFLALNQICNI